MTLKTFDDDKIKKLIKECDPELKLYIEALKRALQGQKDTTVLANKKIKELVNGNPKP